MKRIIILVTALLCGLSARAQQGPWSLSDCISYALEHNLSVQQSALAVEQREVELNSAQNRRLPSLSASASENLSFGNEENGRGEIPIGRVGSFSLHSSSPRSEGVCV